MPPLSNPRQDEFIKAIARLVDAQLYAHGTGASNDLAKCFASIDTAERNIDAELKKLSHAAPR